MSAYGRALDSPVTVRMPARDFHAGGFCCVEVPRNAIGTIQAALRGLMYPDSWHGDKETVNLASLQFESLIIDIGICRVCGSENGSDGESPCVCENNSSVYALIEGFQMGIFITDITCEDGVMYKHYGPCCRVPMDCALDTVIQPPPPDVATDPDEPATWACNKSMGMARTFYDVVVEIIDAISPFSSKYDMYSPCYNVIKKFGAVWASAQLICTNYVANRSEVDVMAADSETVQLLACLWSPMLLQTDSLNGDEYWSMQTNLTTKFTAGQNAFMIPVILAIGLQNFAWWARLFHDDVADCDCPEEPPSASSIFFTGNSALNGGANGTTMLSAQVYNGGRRMLIELQASAGTGSKSMTDYDLELAGANEGDNVTFRLYAAADAGMGVPSEAWEEYSAPAPVPDWFIISCEGANPTLRSNWSNYVEWRTDQLSPTAIPAHCRLEDMRFYPFSGEHPVRVSRFWVEVVAVNGVDLPAIGP